MKATSSSRSSRSATSRSGRSACSIRSEPGPPSTSPRASTPCRTTSAKSLRHSSSRCRGSGRSSTRPSPSGCGMRRLRDDSPTTGGSPSAHAWPSTASPAAGPVSVFACCSGSPTSSCSTTSSARWACTAPGAAPIAPDLIKWYMALGIDMREVYGQTENCGLATAMPVDRIKLGTVGIARPGTEVRISPGGEILLKGPHVFLGYYKNPAKTAETVVDGWLHTGDVGVMDDQGFVRITDRMKDIIITAGGKNVTPSEIENQLKFSPYISDAVVIGDKRNYLTCLIMIDHDNVVKFAQDKNVPFTNYASLCRAPEVQDLIGREVEAANKKFARVETVKKFRLIDQLLTAEDEELTPTMKLKRSLVEKKYGALIKDMYASAA